MNDQMKSLKDDIAFMRALAEEGRKAPPLGGAILVSAGTVFGLASVVQWAVMARVLNVPLGWLAAVWGVALLIFVVSLVLLQAKLGAKPGAHSPVNRATGAVWSGIGMAIFASFLAMMAATWQTRDATLINFSSTIVLLFYGIGWGLTGAMSGQAWMKWTGWSSFAAAIGVAFLIESPAQYLAYAACLFLLAVVPGIVQMRQEPSDIV